MQKTCYNSVKMSVHALSILMVSNLLFSGKSMLTDEREKGFKDMMEVWEKWECI